MEEGRKDIFVLERETHIGGIKDRVEFGFFQYYKGKDEPEFTVKTLLVASKKEFDFGNLVAHNIEKIIKKAESSCINTSKKDYFPDMDFPGEEQHYFSKLPKNTKKKIMSAYDTKLQLQFKK